MIKSHVLYRLSYALSPGAHLGHRSGLSKLKSPPQRWLLSFLQLICASFSIVMPGHSRPKDGVASLAYVPGIHV
jgi:hypothetical protein